MEKETILQVENISKQYRLGVVGTGTLSNDLKRWWYLVRGKEDPFLKVGETNNRSIKGNSDYVWSLKNINFKVEKGEVLGIIGKNGAGKSTLLKILSKVTSPTTGNIYSNGKIASLLEVGTGFHPELTGRENIFLNGAILGMSKAEIKSKISEIIEFSGCERYIDTPTKRYSSGMTVRLAFAVAAFLEPDILIVDEVLAVGDAEFQKKAIGKMKDISTGDNGRTVLFVSHNMAAVKNLCTKGIVLENGEIKMADSIDNCIEYYVNSSVKSNPKPISDRKDRKGRGDLKIIDVKVNESNQVKPGIPTNISLIFDNKLKIATKDYRININITNRLGDTITYISTDFINNKSVVDDSFKRLDVIINNFNLVPNIYNLRIFVEINKEIEDWIEYACEFEVIEEDVFNSGANFAKGYGDFYLDCDFQIS